MANVIVVAVRNCSFGICAERDAEAFERGKPLLRWRRYDYY